MPQHQQRIREATEGELFRLLVENVKDYAIFVMDPAGQVRSWNPGAERLLGYSEGEIIGQPAARFFTPEDIQGGVPRRQMEKAVATGRDEDARWHVRKDGSRFWSAGTITPLWDEGRHLRGFAKIMRDRTSQKHSADALNDALAYAEGVVETVREPLLVLGGDLRVKTANRSFYQTFRVSAGETEGRLIYHLGNSQWDIPQLRTLLEEVLPRNTSFDGFEVEHPFRTIGRKVMLLNARRFYREGNHTELILLAIEDVTERRRAEEERREIETRFTSLVKNIKDHSIFTMDLDGRITSWNVEAERILGYSETEILGQSFSLIFTPEDLHKGMPEQELRRAREEGRAEDERWHVRKGGERFWALGIVTPTHDAGGRHTGFSKILRDMTERKQAELALQRAHENLETQVRERTAELRTANEGLQKEIADRNLLEAQVRQAQKMEAFGQLASGVAHDFNNLLTVINGYSEMLLQDLSPRDPSAELLNEIRRAGERAASLTRQLLTFSRKQVVATRSLNLNAVVTDTEKMLRRVIGEDVSLATSLASGLGNVRADEGQLQQVLMNLAVNARDAMPQGGRLTIETRNVELGEEYGRVHAGILPGQYVLLAVSDTGTGMTEAVQKHLFEPFFTTKEPGKGTGLGLAVVHGVVKQAGGSIEVYSEPGLGTTFKVYLPRVDEPARSSQSLPAVKGTPRGTETILLVEDDEGVRLLTRHLLKEFGYTVLEASEGAEALSVVGKHVGPIHLLITDVIMPGMSGRQVAAELATLHPEAKVLFVSGYPDDAVIRHGILQDKVAFLPKPFSPSGLASKIREVLDSPGSDLFAGPPLSGHS